MCPRERELDGLVGDSVEQMVTQTHVAKRRGKPSSAHQLQSKLLPEAAVPCLRSRVWLSTEAAPLKHGQSQKHSFLFHSAQKSLSWLAQSWEEACRRGKGRLRVGRDRCQPEKHRYSWRDVQDEIYLSINVSGIPCWLYGWGYAVSCRKIRKGSCDYLSRLL